MLLILTIIALPIVFLATRTDDTNEPIASDASVVGGEPLEAGDNGPNRPPLSSTDEEPTFLDGPGADPDPGVAEIAIPARPENPPLRLDASYSSTVASTSSCIVKDLPSGLSVTITNLDNGRSIPCVTSVAPSSQSADLVLHTEAFSQLADITDAPIAIELSR